MGLVKAITGATGGVLADQWKEFIYCDALPADVLMTKGRKKTTSRSSNTKGDENVISNGSVIAVAPGQCMIISEQGKVVDICAEPGEYVYDSSTEPSIFFGDLSTNVKEVFKNIGKRFTFGGEAPKMQVVYYVNTRELMGNKYGTPQAVPFRIKDDAINLNMTIYISCFGEYSYRIVDPISFYTNIAANVSEDFTRDSLDSQLKSELLTALQPALAKISLKGIPYDALPLYTNDIADALNEVLSEKWSGGRGIKIVSFGVSSVKARPEDEEKIQNFQTLSNPTFAAAHMTGATAEALKNAAANQGAGSAMAFMGMNMTQNAGGMNLGSLYEMGARQNAAAQANQAPQGEQAQPMPQAPSGDTWTCACGAGGNTSKFCMECGQPKPAAQNTWTCACGTENKCKFCMECGQPKPQGVPQYKCDKCGWEPSDPKAPPKFCPECGDPFDDGDVK